MSYGRYSNNGSIKHSAHAKVCDGGAQDEPMLSNENINTFLENDISKIKRETWSRLDKTNKLRKLDAFIKGKRKSGAMTDVEGDVLYSYFRTCFDRKRPHSNKVVHYDMDTGLVMSVNDVPPDKAVKLHTTKKNARVCPPLPKGTQKHKTVHKAVVEPKTASLVEDDILSETQNINGHLASSHIKSI